MSGLVQKAKVAVDKVVHPEDHKSGTHSTNAGPHDSNMANKADPRVDSDRDGSRNMGAATGPEGYGTATGPTGYSGTTTGMTGSGMTGSGLTGTTAHGSTNVGPHNSNMANKLDPRVDSDMDGSRNMGASTGRTGYGGTTTGMTGTNMHAGTTTGMTGTNVHGSTNAGPHDSNLANKMDPRFDSDLDGSHTMGGPVGGPVGGHTAYSGTTTTGLKGQHGQSGLTGTTGRTGLTGAAGTGPAPHTAGPHSSDMMNKADPRVDSDLDGSRTVGGNKTFTGQPDASLETPSEFRKHLTHEQHPVDSDHARRHSLAELGAKNTFDKYGAGHQ